MADDKDAAEVDPRDFVQSVLNIAPEDAEKVRDATPGARKPKQDDDDKDEGPRGQYGPTADYGEKSE